MIGEAAGTARNAVCGFILAVALLPSSLTAATGQPEPQASAAKDWTGRAPQSDGPFATGAQIYRNTCAACHDAGANRAPQRLILQDMTPDAIHHALTDGVMRMQAAGLSADDKVAVAQYLAGRKLGANGPAVVLKLCEGRRARFDVNEPPAFSGWGLDAASTHAIPAAVSGLSRQNVGRLHLKWAFGFPDSVRARSQPAVAGGAIFVGAHNGSVYALDRETGCVRWKFDAKAEVRTGVVISPWRAGSRQAKPLVYFGDVAGHVYAVHAFTGALAWTVRAEPHPAATLSGTPTLYRDRLYVPVSSDEEAFATSPAYACCSFRGSVLALDAATGAEKWRRYLVDPAIVRGTSRDGQDILGPSGVAVWNSPAIDVRRNQIYVATGDNYSAPASALSDAIVALDLTTGQIKWHYQALAGDTWNVACYTKTSASCPDDNAPDFDFGAGSVLARSGDGRELVVAGQKSGWVYGLDPATGTLVWKQRVGRGGKTGGVHFGLAADHGRLFVPVSDHFADGPADMPARPGVYALDVGTGAPQWQAPSVDICAGRPLCNPGYGGSLSATAGLVLTGGDDGHVRIFDAADGKVVWDTDTARDFTTINGIAAHGGSISGGVAPIAFKGDLIVPSGYGFASKMPGNVLLVFGVD